LSRTAAITARLDAYERLHPLDKPIGILLLLWPTLSALWLAARGRPTASLVLIFVLGTILMRSAGCAVNDWADRHFDGYVERTAGRPLAAGEIEPWEALGGRGRWRSARSVRARDQPDRRSCCRFRRWRSPSSIRSASASSSPAGLPRHRVLVRHSDGVRRRPRHRAADRVVDALLNLFWVVAYDTNMRWSIAMMTFASASTRRRSPSDASM
jgi:hypothetical protein